MCSNDLKIDTSFALTLPLFPRAEFRFVTENILSHTCVVLKTYDAIYSVVYVLDSNAYYCAIISLWVTNKKGTCLQKVVISHSLGKDGCQMMQSTMTDIVY